MPRFEYATRWGGYCACPCGGLAWPMPRSREEFVEEFEDYKAKLESEIVALEKRIKALKEKAE